MLLRPDLDKDLLMRVKSSSYYHPDNLYRWSFWFWSWSASLCTVRLHLPQSFWFFLWPFFCIVHACMHFLSQKYDIEYNLVLSPSTRWKLYGLTMNRDNEHCTVQSGISVWYVLYGCTLDPDFVIGIAFKLQYSPSYWEKQLFMIGML